MRRLTTILAVMSGPIGAAAYGYLKNFRRNKQVKSLGWILVLLMATAPAWAEKKVTVQQLKDLLVSMQQSKKTDSEAADQLKEIELNEELTGSAANSLKSYLPGPYTSVQVEILKEQSAFLAPPATDLPTAPVPDAAAQQAILAKAADFASRVYVQNPHLSVTKTTLRFEDHAITTNSIGIHNSNSLLAPVQLVDNQVDLVETDKGIEQAAASRAKTKWGMNGEISEGEPGTNLDAIFLEASSSGKINWLRWQMIDGRQTAVFSFAVEKEKSHFDVSYCCFPRTETATHVASASLVMTTGSILSVSTWEPFKKIAGYHGEFFINPDTSLVVRVITRAEMKPTDLVFREDRRIDYGPVVIAGKSYLLPHLSITAMTAIPNGDNNTASSVTRHTLLFASYQNYKLAGTR
jgi:hypothetical protein